MTKVRLLLLLLLRHSTYTFQNDGKKTNSNQIELVLLFIVLRKKEFERQTMSEFHYGCN